MVNLAEFLVVIYYLEGVMFNSDDVLALLHQKIKEFPEAVYVLDSIDLYEQNTSSDGSSGSIFMQIFHELGHPNIDPFDFSELGPCEYLHTSGAVSKHSHRLLFAKFHNLERHGLSWQQCFDALHGMI